MKLARLFLVTILIAAQYSTARAADVAVTVGQDGSEFDACGGVGKVTGLNPNGDNYLAVRSGPGAKNTELDRLGPETQVFMCDRKGKWIGIVYLPAGRDGLDCGVGSPVPEPQAYGGPCKSGWVFEKYIELIAG